MHIRKATSEDLPRIHELYLAGRRYMRAHGNTVQWSGRDVPEENLEDDIRKGQLYVLEDEGGVHAVFAFIFGAEKDYAVIEGGAWRSDAPYATVHRFASDGTCRGVFDTAFAWMSRQTDHIRVDTHETNLTMQHVVQKNGFVYCGVIHVTDGSPRLAYEWVRA